MKIVLTEPLEISADKLEELSRPLRKAGHEFAAYNQRARNIGELNARVKDADIAIIANGEFSEETARLCHLKYMSVAFTGVDHVALDALREKGKK